MYRQSGKNLLSNNMSSICPHNMANLWPSSGGDCFGSLGHPSKFQRLACLGSITARHPGSGHQPNFAALNRGRHLYSAGWPSHWALAHIVVLIGLHCALCCFACAVVNKVCFMSVGLFTVSHEWCNIGLFY